MTDPVGALSEVFEPRAAPDPTGPLHGVPFAVKELFDVAGTLTTAGTEVPFVTEPARRDAPAVARLRRAGGVLVGRARTHEFAWGITTRHPRLGGVVNPHNPTRVAGGSSGGSAAAVAAGLVAFALGTDTGGSTRIPAAWCGVVGWKPAYGRIPLEGVVPLAPTLDHVGVLARSVQEAVAVVDIAAGDPPAALSAASPPHLRIAVGVAPDLPQPQPAVAAAVARACDLLGRQGATLEEVRLPSAMEVQLVHQTIQRTEALAGHRAMGVWPRFADLYGDDVRARFELAESVTDEEAQAARGRRHELMAEQTARLDPFDAVLLPVSPCGPSTLDDPDHVVLHGTRMALRDAVMPFTLFANLVGFPACSIPAGTDEDGLPVGLQLLAVPARERTLASVAALLDGYCG